LPILVGIDRRTKWIFAHMVPSKGLDAHAIKMMQREVRLSGYSRMILKSDQEPSILALLEAVKREKGEAIELTGKVMNKAKEELQMIAEESPVGEHPSNGEVENAIKSAQSQIRTMRLALQARYKTKIRTDHPIMPWLVHHAALLIDICRIGTDGCTPYERRKGKKFHRPLPEIGECIWYLKPQSVGKDKLDTRWESGVFAGLRAESGELYVLTDKGAIKVNSFNRRPEEERWNQEEFGGIQGTPWEPIPGRGGIEVKSRFLMRGEEEIIAPPSTREVIPRRIYIRREDVSESKYGLTPGCKGCEAANRGSTGIHSEACRKRVEGEILQKEPERYHRVIEKIGSMVEEDVQAQGAPDGNSGGNVVAQPGG
jgi:hypothetical protein